MKHNLIMENWRKFIAETSERPALPLDNKKINIIFELTVTKFIQKIMSGIIPDDQMKRYEFFSAKPTSSTQITGTKDWEYSYNVPVHTIKPKSKGEKASDYLHWFAAFKATHGLRPRDENGAPTRRFDRADPTSWLQNSKDSDQILYETFQEALAETFSPAQLETLYAEMGLDNPQYNGSLISFSPVRKQPDEIETFTKVDQDGNPTVHPLVAAAFPGSDEYTVKTKQPDKTSSYYNTLDPGEVSLSISISQTGQKKPELPIRRDSDLEIAFANLDKVKMSDRQSPHSAINYVAHPARESKWSINIPKIVFKIHTGFTNQPAVAGSRDARSK